MNAPLRRVQLIQDRRRQSLRNNLKALGAILLLIFADPFAQWVASLFE